MFLADPLAAGIAIVSNHNTIMGLQVQHFPFGIAVVAGLTAPGTFAHITVKDNVLKESGVGILVFTGDTPGSVLTDTTVTRNLVQHTFFGILVQANQSAAGADARITPTAITDNEVRQNGDVGILVFPLGDHNHITDLTIARNTAAENGARGVLVYGDLGEADENTLNVHIRDNTVTDNGAPASASWEAWITAQITTS